jgi:hypothetical protein
LRELLRVKDFVCDPEAGVAVFPLVSTGYEPTDCVNSLALVVVAFDLLRSWLYDEPMEGQWNSPEHM